MPKLTKVQPVVAGGTSARAMRLQRRLTLDQLTEMTGLSKGHLSRFERGEKSLSIAALMRLAQALGTTVSVLLGERLDDEAIHLVRTAERRESRVEVDEGDYRFSLLSRSEHPGDAEVFTITLSGGAGIPAKGVHDGQESLFVLDGEIQIQIGERVFNLQVGDYLEFPGAFSHYTTSKSASATILVMVRSR
jgi:transcriptional regulator with XRE-family HTH domain